MSFMYMLKRVGLNSVPCGTPQLIELKFEEVSRQMYMTCNFRKQFIRSKHESKIFLYKKRNYIQRSFKNKYKKFVIFMKCFVNPTRNLFFPFIKVSIFKIFI